MRKKLAGILGAAVLGGAVSLVAAAPAQAYVYNCGTSSSGSHYWAYCSSGNGTFRLLLDCANVSGVRTIGSDTKSRVDSDGTIATTPIGCGSGYPSNPRVDAR